MPFLNPRYASAVAGGGPGNTLSVTVTLSNDGLYGGGLVWRAPSLTSNSSWCPHNQVRGDPSGTYQCASEIRIPVRFASVARRGQVLWLVRHPCIGRALVQRVRSRVAPWGGSACPSGTRRPVWRHCASERERERGACTLCACRDAANRPAGRRHVQWLCRLSRR